MSGAQQVIPCSELDPVFWFSEPGLGGVQESGSIFHPLSPFLEPVLRPLGNPEIPVAPGVEHYVLDTSLDEVYFALQ